MVKVRRIYDAATPGDSEYRILIDRLWPRGVRKGLVDYWAKDVSPTSELRRWFDHDPEKFEEFRGRYIDQLDNSEALESLARMIQSDESVVLVYGARDRVHNHAVVLQELLSDRYGL